MKKIGPCSCLISNKIYRQYLHMGRQFGPLTGIYEISSEIKNKKKIKHKINWKTPQIFKSGFQSLHIFSLCFVFCCYITQLLSCCLTRSVLQLFYGMNKGLSQKKNQIYGYFMVFYLIYLLVIQIKFQYPTLLTG